MSKVRFLKGRYLYVENIEVDDTINVVKVDNPFKDIDIPQEVDLAKVGKKYYVKGYQPKSKSYNKKKD